MLTRAVDVYALGGTLLHLATLAPPYDGLTDMQILRRHINGRPPAVPESLPAGLRKVVACCLALEPEDRPTAAQVAHDLKRLKVRRIRDGSSQ